MKELYNRVKLCPYRKIGATCDVNFDEGKYNKFDPFVPRVIIYF